MRKIVICTLTLLLSSAAFAETVTVNVNGMICSFCAFSIEKLLSKREEVEKVKIDLDSKRVEIGMRPGKTLDDGTISKIIVDSGYDVTGIVRLK